MNCQRCQNELATLLLDPANPAAAAVQAHVNDCASCAAELNALRATMSLMDEWTAPAPSPFFDTRLHARMREVDSAPASLWERLRSRWAFNLRPVAAGALAILLLAGGGSYAGFNALHPHQTQVSAAVQDLQSLDKNDQTIATMDQLVDDDGSNDSGAGN
jgi:outer membrane murein-binding lipoprotein Lpp